MTHASMTYHLGSTAHQLHFRQGSTDEWVIKQVLVDRQYDLRQTDRIGELLDHAARLRAGGRKPLIVDAGANIGAASVYFRDQVPDAHIVAIEPAPDNFELLLRNVEGLGVETFNGAVSSTTGRARVVDPGRGEWAYRTISITETDGSSETVPRVTINEIFRAHAVNTFPFLVKVDIEGAEGELFSGNTDWVARTPLLIVELHDWLLPKQRTSQPFLRCIAQLDRDFVYLGESVFSIANDFESLASA
jgi:FkbM family methyltransferase